MKDFSKRILFWSPRILSILFAIFISLFALDVLGEGWGFWHTSMALIMHLIPTFIIIAVLILAWRWEWIGAVMFSVLAVIYIVWAWGRFPISTYVIMTAPMWIVALLFAFNWRDKIS